MVRRNSVFLWKPTPDDAYSRPAGGRIIKIARLRRLAIELRRRFPKRRFLGKAADRCVALI